MGSDTFRTPKPSRAWECFFVSVHIHKSFPEREVGSLAAGGFRIEYFRTLDAKRQGEENGGLETAEALPAPKFGKKEGGSL